MSRIAVPVMLCGLAGLLFAVSMWLGGAGAAYPLSYGKVCAIGDKAWCLEPGWVLGCAGGNVTVSLSNRTAYALTIEDPDGQLVTIPGNSTITTTIHVTAAELDGVPFVRRIFTRHTDNLVESALAVKLTKDTSRTKGGEK